MVSCRYTLGKIVLKQNLDAGDRRLLKQTMIMQPTDKEIWYRTDNAGRIFASPGSLNNVYRISVTLKEIIHADLLQKALENIMIRFPYFSVQVRPAVFWSHLRINTSTPQVTADARYPCQQLHFRRQGQFPFRVRAFYKRIAVEFTHALTDGTGALQFLRSLTAEYLRLRGVRFEPTDDLMHPDQTQDPQESEDAFRRYWQKGLPRPAPAQKAFRLETPCDRKGIYHITTGLLPLDKTLGIARQYGISITELVVALCLDTFQSVFQSLSRRQRKRNNRPICIEVPVNLRPLFPSRTLRNFFVSATVCIDPRLGMYSFEQIIKRVHHTLRNALDDKELSRQISRNVGAERHPLLRIVPHFLKDKVLPEIYRQYSLKSSTSSISNLGRVTMPDALAEQIERFDFVPTYPNIRRIGCAMISFSDHLTLTFGRTTIDPVIERGVFRRLASLGCPIHVETNGGE